MRKILILASICVFIGVSLSAQQVDNRPLWLRHSAISPNGETIAFAYQGDIFTVSSNGGSAKQITSNPAYDNYPIWSPDGSTIVFSSDREGSFDIYKVSSKGGIPTRLTTHSGSEIPVTFKGADSILFQANIMPSAKSIQFPESTFSQVYTLSINGGRPSMFSTIPLEYISFSKDFSSFLYNDKKGYENIFRKHHTSPITRDIWKFENDKYTKLTSFKGEDRNPIYTTDNTGFYYLSEKDGTFNVWKKDLESGKSTQITTYSKNPVRYLTMSNNETLCFDYDGEIYILNKGDKTASRVNIKITKDQINKKTIKKIISRGATDFDISDDGIQIAFIYHGDVYVTSAKYKTTKRITNTAEQERNVDLSPDGRSVLYSSQRNGLWQLYQTTIVKKDEKTFPYCTELKEENLTNSDVPSFQGSYSPDGKEVAFYQNRTAICVINLKSKEVRTVMDKKYGYSYSDGDQNFSWSPNGKWILTTSLTVGGWNNPDVVLLDASRGGKNEGAALKDNLVKNQDMEELKSLEVDGQKGMYNLTRSGYADAAPKWALDGKAIIWSSDRAGYRSHGSWGSERDEYIMFLDFKAYDKFTMNDEDLALLAAEEKAEKSKREIKKAAKDSIKTAEAKSKGKTPKSVETLKIDIVNAHNRVFKLTANSSKMGDAVLSLDGKKLYYLASFESRADLWVRDLKNYSTKILMKGAGNGGLLLSKNGRTLYLITRSGIKAIDTMSGRAKPFGAFESVFEYKPFAERQYMFDHVWRQVKEKFYVKDLQGCDWDYYRTEYEKFLPYINNDRDFADVLSEMLGELDASHTGAGARVYDMSLLPTANLGLFYDPKYKGDGLKILEIIKDSPLYLRKGVDSDADYGVGSIITKIDGKEIKAGEDYFPLLEGKVGKRIRLTITNTKGKKPTDIIIKGLSSRGLSSLLYQRWVERNSKMVEKLTNGKIGYIHIKGMDSPSFRKLYSELLGKYRHCDAVMLDIRHNGGGWLHEDIVTLMTGNLYCKFIPRGQYIGDDPFARWCKPSCMITCEDCYSNASGTPWIYQNQNIGKLVGAPVAGTMTAVWWETLINPSIVFGIPEVGMTDLKGKYLENWTIEPDVLIYNTPEDVVSGNDEQIKAAIKVLEKEVSSKPASLSGKSLPETSHFQLKK
ncbi:MAG: S41 family peptidase [Bacteroidales bacterium]